ncbi:MAG TPA: alcohol dehydrogenase catalytic domain-containing protein, partial [Candidatus Hydrogenedentes bacterium]|nr:alcohol dehydrogenase catalytic domain-containing protein [Candidatus Hydrogenedentota bacterium]
MKACVLRAVGDLRCEDAPDPKPGPGEALIAIKACGVCGSDIPRVFEKGTYRFPTIPGHEMAGEVVSVGAGCDSVLLGKTVAVFPLIPCRRCEACEIGAYAQCADYNYLGSRCDGGFAEYVVAPAWNLQVVPDGVSYEAAAMCEPAAVAAHALRRADLGLGDSVAIFGAGPIGIMLAQWARRGGASRVLLADIDDAKIEFARRLWDRLSSLSEDEDRLG